MKRAFKSLLLIGLLFLVSCVNLPKREDELSSLYVLKATAHGWIHFNARAYITLNDPRDRRKIKPDYEIAGYSFYHDLEQGTYLFHSGSGNRTYYDLLPIKKEIEVTGRGLQYLGSFRILTGPVGAKDIVRIDGMERREDLRRLDDLIKKSQRSGWQLELEQPE